MSVNKETDRYTHLQPRGCSGALTLYRVDLKRLGVVSQTYENLDVAKQEILINTKKELVNIPDLKMLLGFNLSTAAILFIETIKLKSKTLGILTGVTACSAIYLNNLRRIHGEELLWLNKENRQLGVYEKSNPS
jgi:hypothetical protein